MNYFVREVYRGKNFLNQNVEVPAGIFVERIGDLIYFKGIPFCTWRSQVAKDYLIWNGDGCFKERSFCEGVILFEPRLKKWKDYISVYDDTEEVLRKKETFFGDRFSPAEISFIKKRFPQLVEERPGLFFNDFFYTGSDIGDVRDLALYLQR